MMKIIKSKKAFTLMEVLIAASIFVVLVTISTSILISTINTDRQTTIRNNVYEDGRIIMEQLANFIQNNAIDYEEYYSIKVLQKADADADAYYGLYYGAYASRFYYPGYTQDNNRDTNPDPSTSVGTNPRDLGVECYDLNEVPPLCEIYLGSRDENWNQNPFVGDLATANAFCDNLLGPACGPDQNIVDELYLISEDASNRYVFVKQNMDSTNFTIGMLKLDGTDVDQNGVMDIYTCDPAYDCTDITEKLADIAHPIAESGLTISSLKMDDKRYPDKFLPLIPIRSNVANINFIINPLEDPYKAIGEIDEQRQPSVTIILELTPSESEMENYPGGWPMNGVKPQSIVIQRTVTTGVRSEVLSYPATNVLTWLSGIITEPLAP